MRIFRRVARLLDNLFRREDAESRLDEEIRAYVDEMAERKVREGLPPAEARRQALIEAGGVEQVKEEVRGVWAGNAIETAARDLRYGMRALRRDPGFAVVALATLALGIGASVTMFSVMRGVLWRPLPYPAAGRIVVVRVDTRGVTNAGAAPGEVHDLRARSRLLEAEATITAVDANLDLDGDMVHLAAASVSDDFLPLLGAHPMLGRLLDSRIDEGPERVLRVLISHSLWRNRFDSDPEIAGRGIRINNMDVEIAGVLPEAFKLYLPPSVNAAEEVDVWFPTGIGVERQYRGYPVVARLKAGVTPEQANAELASIAQQFVSEHPASYPDGKVRFTAAPLQDEISREARPALWLLTLAVASVLLIACVNAANLMLARGAARQRELAIRRAMGAGVGRLMRQLLIESMALGLGAGAVGLALADSGVRALLRLAGSRLPLESRISLDGPVVLFALVLAIATSLIFGMLPAWRLAASGVSDPLRAGRSETAAPGMRALQRGLVIAEVALAVAPLLTCGLMLRTFLNLVHAPLGFQTANVLTAKVPMNFRAFPETAQRWTAYRGVVDRVRSMPGVEAASAAGPLPLASSQITRRVRRAEGSVRPAILATQQTILPGYLQVVSTPLLEGRDFTIQDEAAARPVAIIDQRLARLLWPGGAVGRRLAIEDSAGAGVPRELEIVGVTAAVRSTRVRDDGIPHVMVPYHVYPIEVSLVVRTGLPVQALAPAIRQAVNASHTGRATFEIRPLGELVADSTAAERFTVIVLATFAAASILLAAAGVYGTLAYLIAQRTREFGIRLALGATASGITALVVREGAALAAVGGAFGLAGAAAASRAMERMLYGVHAFDGLTLLCVAAVVMLVAVVAAGAPAFRAARIDPAASLRSE